jgi:YgiT-type zinc finger domain-containing protein
MKKSKLFLNLVGTRCGKCESGKLATKEISYDLGPALGMKSVRVENLPALVCSSCGEVTVTGPVVEGVSLALAVLILQRVELDQIEVRFLRKLLGDTQEEFAKKLCVERVTVNRWENAKEPIAGITAKAIQLHACVRLCPRSSTFEKLKEALTAMAPRRAPKPRSYRLDGSNLPYAIAA